MNNIKKNLTQSFSYKKHKEKTGLSKEYQKQEKLLSVLEKTSQYLAAETNLEIILKRIATTLGKALGAKYVNFWELTPDKTGVYIIAAYGMQKAYVEHSKITPLKLGTAWVGRAMSTGQTWATKNCPADPRLPSAWLPAVQKQKFHGLLCMPLKKNKEIIGGMCIYYKNVHDFDELEMNIATIVANQAATAVSNARLFNDLSTERNKTFSIIQSLKEGLIMYDLEGKIIFFNNKAEQMLWVASKDVIGKTLHEKNKNIALNNIYTIGKIAKSDYASKEYSIENPNKIILEITYIPVRNQNNQKIGSMKILRDITKEKELEILKNSFVSTASHQLRTPLSGIKWSLDLLGKEDFGKLNSKQHNLIKKTSKINQDLIEMINDLLDVSKIEEGRFEYKLETCDLVKIIHKTINNLTPIAQKKKIKIEFNPPQENLPKINLDPVKISISIKNVIDNAIKYNIPNGFVKIKLTKERRSLILEIRDNGIGIPIKDQKFIFNKFFRAENAIKAQTSGSGLGLYIAKSIAEKHDCNLSFESQEDKGSLFIFQFIVEENKK